MNDIDFARGLVKGRIAATIFAEMLRQTDAFTVLEFGYEKMGAQLVDQGHGQGHSIPVIETLRVAPDFAVIDRATKEVHLVEVEYRPKLHATGILQYAEKMQEAWDPSYLFIVTPDGFYFDEISRIILNDGEISPLSDKHIPQELQAEYLQILRDFEAPGSFDWDSDSREAGQRGADSPRSQADSLFR